MKTSLLHVLLDIGHLADIDLSPCLFGFADHLIDGLPGLSTETDDTLSCPRRIGDLDTLWQEAGEEVMGHDHHFDGGRLRVGVGCERERHHCAVVIGECLVLHKPQGGVEFERSFEIGDRKI